MNNILIATDFSTASTNATIYGLHLAKSINAKVILFNAYKITSPAAGLGVSISRYDVMVQTRQQLLDEAQKISYINMPELETICDEGEAEEAIMHIAVEKKAGLIITGMKGSGKNYKKIFGNTVTLLTKHTGIPLIIVPEDARYKHPDNLIFASDDIIDLSQYALKQLITITKVFKSKLYVVKVITNKVDEGFKVSATGEKINTLSEIPGSSVEYFVDTDVNHGLNEFIKNRDGDMLIMMPHRHNRFEKLFIKSETKDMIFHTHIPLLVLPESEVNEIQHPKAAISSIKSVAY